MMTKRTREQQQQTYQLDPAIAAALRRPVRTDLTEEDRAEFARLEAIRLARSTQEQKH